MVENEIIFHHVIWKTHGFIYINHEMKFGIRLWMIKSRTRTNLAIKLSEINI